MKSRVKTARKYSSVEIEHLLLTRIYFFLDAFFFLRTVVGVDCRPEIAQSHFLMGCHVVVTCQGTADVN